MVILVLLAKTFQDLDCLLHRRWIDDYCLESTLQRPIFFDVLAVLVERRRTDALQLAARERGLEHVARVDRAFRCASADQRVQLVDEENDVLVLRDLIHDGFETLLELPAVLRTRDHGRHV